MNGDILIAASYLPGVTKVQILGRNAAISNAAETVWTTGGTYAQLTAAVALEAVSSSANDAAAGTGARTIEVDLIDGNYAASTVIGDLFAMADLFLFDRSLQKWVQ